MPIKHKNHIKAPFKLKAAYSHQLHTQPAHFNEIKRCLPERMEHDGQNKTKR